MPGKLGKFSTIVFLKICAMMVPVKKTHEAREGIPGPLFVGSKEGSRVPALSGKHERFCQEYVIDYNGTQAAIRANYSEASAKQQAYRLLQREDIRERILELQKEQVARLSISQDFVMLQMLDTYHCCREAYPLMEWDYAAREMVETGKYAFDSKGALKALEMMGKHLGMFDKKSTNPEDSEKSNLLDMLLSGTGEDIDTDDLSEVQ